MFCLYRINFQTHTTCLSDDHPISVGFPCILISKFPKVDPEKERIEDRNHPEGQDGCKDQTKDDGNGHGLPHVAV